MSFSFPNCRSSLLFRFFCFVKLDFPKVNAKERRTLGLLLCFPMKKSKKGGEQTNLAMDIGRQSRKRTTAWPASHSRRNKGDSTSLKEEENKSNKRKKEKTPLSNRRDDSLPTKIYRQTDRQKFICISF